ncbi:acyltransferase family protein [Gulosibacter sp. 10]|uniref:acyltransferase family protein n=1 Tax=Gulosibacter sp. 10 TaxID=1255570 RepID=UPI001595C70F|nr:acyltransferase family protein [Gulosibacter sp. 10]
MASPPSRRGTGAHRARRPAPRLGFIPEVQGLRTLALLLVVVFHIWFGRVSGGVDVFLLVSAFLLTRSLAAASEAGARPAPLRTILQRFARLLPVAAAVIVLTLLAAWLLVPRHLWGDTNWDALAALFYVENWRLILENVDYYAGGDAASSLFQHFWSLSVQGQIFILWPFLHLLGYGIARRLGRGVRGVLIALFGAVFAVSFAWSVWLTAADQQVAYFETGARAWEFAAGSLLALVLPALRLGPALRALLGWLGVAMLVACGFVLPVESTFPGFAALWPVAAAALVIAAAGAPTRLGADRLLTRRWFGGLGHYSYALYLVHWPVLILYRRLGGLEEVPLLDGLWIMAISAAASALLVHLVERPAARAVGRRVPGFVRAGPLRRTPLLRPARRFAAALRSPRIRSTPAATVAVCLVAAGLVAGGGELVRSQLAAAEAGHAQDALSGGTPAPSPEPTEEDRSPGWDPITIEVGAEAPGLPSVADPLPGAGSIEYEWAGEGAECAEYDTPPGTDGVCFESLGAGPDAPTALFVGNSHTQQFAAIGYRTAEISESLNVRLQAGPGCPLRDGDLEADDACGKTWRAALDYIANERPEFVVLVGTMSAAGEADEPMTGAPEWIEQALESSPGTSVIVLRDSPRFETAPYECGLANGWDASACEVPAPPAVDPGFIAEVEAAGGTWTDLSEHICPDGVCRPQVGGVVVWFDENHLTATYVKTLVQHFADAVAEDVPDWPAELYARP